MHELHSRELKTQKDLILQQEKIKRDKWIQEKTKQIKDQTVKRLEPEIQNLIAQHKVQLRQLEEKYRQQLMKEKSLLIDQHQQQLQAQADKHISERQKACEEERDFARSRYQKQLERDEMEFQQQKRKLTAEFDETKHNIIESMKLERKQSEFEFKKQVEQYKNQIDLDQENKIRMVDEIRKKHVVEINQLREKMQIEKEEWQGAYMRKIEEQVRIREKAFKEKLLKERDSEIEMVIQRLESETDSNQTDNSRGFRMEIQRLKTQHSQNVKELKDQHSLALDNLITIRSQLDSVENEKRIFQKQILELQHQLAIKV